jgi:hypothetical protein
MCGDVVWVVCWRAVSSDGDGEEEECEGTGHHTMGEVRCCTGAMV